MRSMSPGMPSDEMPAGGANGRYMKRRNKSYER